MKLPQLNTALLPMTFSLIVLAIIFYLSWLGNFIKSPLLIFYSLGTVLLMGIFQAVVASNTITTDREKLLKDEITVKERLLEEKITIRETELKEEINKLKNATANLALSNELREKGNIMTTEVFQETEGKMEIVWIVLEDLDIFNKDKGASEFKEFNLENVKNGKTYVYFTSKDYEASVRDYISMATGGKIDFHGSIPKAVKVGKGEIKFVFIDPKAFLFLSPITIWFPSREKNKNAKKKVFLDFPKYPVRYHLVVEDELSAKIYNKLAELFQNCENSQPSNS